MLGQSMQLDFSLLLSAAETLRVISFLCVLNGPNPHQVAWWVWLRHGGDGPDPS